NKKYEKTKDENITNLSFAFSLAIKQLNAIGKKNKYIVISSLNIVKDAIIDDRNKYNLFLLRQ
ncbi:hypothetical protein CFSAN001076_04996, partial [Salmonella enterica subsp. enterica serovar Litchfield str. CFSAN001076]